MPYWLTDVFVYGTLLFYFGVLGVIAVYGFHRYVLVYLYCKHRNTRHAPADLPQTLPRVTVQLPMYQRGPGGRADHRRRLRLDWPRDRLEIQVLDDSTDGSADIARAAVDHWAAKGVDIKYLHRTDRTGYKAGALAEGMKAATGEFIAIFDADFVPPADVLYNVMPHLGDAKVGMVQVRWDHLNRDASLLTKGQAIFLDGHFVIEHTARNRSGRFMHFNGTAGVWRRTTIDDAGGWQHDTLTEDLDLSYRAQLKGWQFVYLPQYAAPAELPPEMIAFKQQAHRWTKGSAQTALKLLPRILASKTLPKHVKTEAFFHLTNTVVYPFMVVLTLMMYPAFILAEAPLKYHPLAQFLFGFTLFVLATCSASTFFVFAQSELFGKKTGWKTVIYLPFIMALGVGLSLNNTRAVIEAIWTRHQYKQGRQAGAQRVRPHAQVRDERGGSSRGSSPTTCGTRSSATTPGEPPAGASSAVPKPIWTLNKLMLPIIEIAFGVYMACYIFISLKYHYALPSVPFLLIFSVGYFYVGFSSLSVLWRMHQERAATIAERAEAAEPPVLPA